MQMPNGDAIERNRNHINYTPPFFRSREEAILDFICWHNPPKTKLKEQQTHKTQRSVLAHFISCCPIPMGSVNAEEVKWTEGKKLQGGCGWCAGLESLQHRETASGNPWPVITSPSLSLLQLNEICFYIFSINSVAPSCRTHTHNWITLLAQKFAIKMANGFTQRLKLRFTVSAIYGKCQNKKKKNSKFPLANAKKFKGKAELKNRLDLQLIVARDIDECSAQLVADSR